MTSFMNFGSSGTSTGSIIPYIPFQAILDSKENNKVVKKLVKYIDIEMMQQYRDISTEELRYNDYLMGRNRKAPQTSIGNFLFGNNNNNTASMFGSQAKTPGTGFQFNPPAPVQPFQFQFNNPATIFGNQGAGTTNTGLFGQKTNTGTGLFGATGTTFGQTTTPTTTFGTGIFGQTNNTTANTTNSWLNQLNKPATPATGFGVFGQPAVSTNIFGQPATTPAATPTFGTGIFDQQTNTGTGLFGNTPAPSIWNTSAVNSTKSPFTFTPATTSTAPTPFQFQWPSTNNQPKIQPLPAQNLFGLQPQPQPQQQSIFGQTANPTGFSFQPTPPAFNFGVPQQQFAQPQQQFIQPQQQFFQPQQQQFFQPQQQQQFFQPQQPFIPLQQQFVWNGLVTAESQAQVPTAITHGRYPSIFNPDPKYNSPLYDWVTNPLSGKTLYASGVNDRLRSHLLPIGSELPTLRSESSRDLFKTASTEQFMNWNEVFNNNVRRAQLRNCPSRNQVQRYRPAFKTFSFDQDFRNDINFLGGRQSGIPASDRKFKRLDTALVSKLQGSGRNSRSSFLNPRPRIGEPRPMFSLRREMDMKLLETIFKEKPEPEVPIPAVGFFEQPFDHEFEWRSNPAAAAPPSPPTRRGPPIRNDSVGRFDHLACNHMNHMNDGGSDFDRNMHEQRMEGSLNSNISGHQQQGLPAQRLQVQFMDMPPPASRGGVNLQQGSREKYTGPRPRSQSHTLKLYGSPEVNFPCRVVTFNKPKYYCIPDVATLHLMVSASTGRCIVEDFEVGHEDFGKVVFPGILDVKGLNIDEIIKFRHKEIEIYPDDNKPPYNQELNRLAVVTLSKVWPFDRHTGELIRNEDDIATMRYEDILRRSCNRFQGNFINYNSTSGLWTFEIQTQP